MNEWRWASDDQILWCLKCNLTQLALCESLCVILAIATFVSLHRNRHLFSKVNDVVRDPVAAAFHELIAPFASEVDFVASIPYRTAGAY